MLLVIQDLFGDGAELLRTLESTLLFFLLLLQSVNGVDCSYSSKPNVPERLLLIERKVLNAGRFLDNLTLLSLCQIGTEIHDLNCSSTSLTVSLKLRSLLPVSYNDGCFGDLCSW